MGLMSMMGKETAQSHESTEVLREIKVKVSM